MSACACVGGGGWKVGKEEDEERRARCPRSLGGGGGGTFFISILKGHFCLLVSPFLCTLSIESQCWGVEIERIYPSADRKASLFDEKRGKECPPPHPIEKEGKKGDRRRVAGGRRKKQANGRRCQKKETPGVSTAPRGALSIPPSHRCHLDEY